MAGRRAKRTIFFLVCMCVCVCVCVCVCGSSKYTQAAFNHYVFKIMYISYFPQLCISKTAGRRAKRAKIGVSGVSTYVYGVLLRLSVLGHFELEVIRCISDIRQPCIRLVIEQNEATFRPRGYLLYTL